MEEDFLAHEIAHSYLHDPDSNKLEAEIEVEKVLAYVNSAKASKEKSGHMKRQYLALAGDHIRRYMLQKEEKAVLNDEKFDARKEMQELYEEYAADFGGNDNYSARETADMEAMLSHEGAEPGEGLEAILEDAE